MTPSIQLSHFHGDQSWSDGLPRARPEERGVDPAAVAAFLEDAQQSRIELNSFMLWRTGAVIAEGWWWPYRADRHHMMHSATKSFLSAGVGLAIAEGRFALEDRVVSFFPDKVKADPGSNLAHMTVEDLLTQTSGHAHGASGGKWRSITTSWIDEFLKIPVSFKPGTKFTYSSATSFMLSAILSRTTGMTAHAFLTPRLLDPLGIVDLRWDVGPENINPGGNGISCRTADLLKLAILHVQGGKWQDQQLLPQSWVAAATRPQRANRHGYHWWMGPDRSFYAYGVFGQFAWAYPDQGGVLAVTAAVPGNEEALRALAVRHLPALFTSDGDRTAPASALLQRCATLRLLPFAEETNSPLADTISGITFACAPNEDGVAYFRVIFQEAHVRFHMGDARGEHVIDAGLTDWIESDTTMTGARLHHGYEPDILRVVAAGRWTAQDVFEMTWQFIETSFRDTVVLRFEGETAKLDRSVNVNTFPTTRPTIHATRLNKDVPVIHSTLMGALALAAQSLPAPKIAPQSYSTTTTMIGELLDTPATRAVLEADAPSVVRNPRIDEARQFTLSDIVQYAPQLTRDVLAKLDVDLAKVERPSMLDRP